VAMSKSFSSIVREALDKCYARFKRIEKLRELEQQVCGKTLLAPVDEILDEIEEMRHESNRI